MAKYYYNDVLLPEIPADVLANYPYAWICLGTDNVTYHLLLSPSPWFFVNDTKGMEGATPAWYKTTLESDDFTLFTSYTNTRYVGIQNGVVWSNHDIPNGSATATEIYFYGSDPVPESGGETPDTLYIVNGSSLTAVADAIRGKAGTTGELAFPDGYVSAVEDISSVSDLSNAKDIAFGGNESGGKYVIEDETITPLFDQIQRITETEEAMTFEGATESLLNVVPGGAFPSAEEASFGVDSGELEFGITNLGTKYDFSPAGYSAGWSFEPGEAISVHGLRYYDYFAAGDKRVLTLWNPNGEVAGQVEYTSVNDSAWHSVMFDTPVNIGVGETYTVSVFDKTNYSVGSPKAKNTKFNAKLNNVTGLYSSTQSNVMPTVTYSGYTPLVDIIIGSVAAELPDDYQVLRTTMDDIAVEVQRISGTTGKMTTSQMLTALQSITLQDKTVTPTTEVQTVTPDSGYFALSSVTVGAITEENEAVTEIVNEKMEVVANDTY